MKLRKLLTAAMAAALAASAIPVFSLADGFRAVTHESRQMSKLQNAWQQIDATEAKAIEAGLSRKEILRMEAP